MHRKTNKSDLLIDLLIDLLESSAWLPNAVLYVLMIIFYGLRYPYYQMQIIEEIWIHYDQLYQIPRLFWTVHKRHVQ